MSMKVAQTQPSWQLAPRMSWRVRTEGRAVSESFRPVNSQRRAVMVVEGPRGVRTRAVAALLPIARAQPRSCGIVSLSRA